MLLNPLPEICRQIALLIGQTGRVRGFILVTSASLYMAEWVLACLQRKVFRGGRVGRGDGLKQQGRASSWLSLSINELLPPACRNFEGFILAEILALVVNTFLFASHSSSLKDPY